MQTVTERTRRLFIKPRLELTVFNECYVTERENSIFIINKTDDNYSGLIRYFLETFNKHCEFLFCGFLKASLKNSRQKVPFWIMMY
jgi:hypothetical protein